MEFYQLNPNVVIRKIKNKIFMVNPFLDYTKCNLPEITPKAEMICNFLKTPHIYLNNFMIQNAVLIPLVSIFGIINQLPYKHIFIIWLQLMSFFYVFSLLILNNKKLKKNKKIDIIFTKSAKNKAEVLKAKYNTYLTADISRNRIWM